MKPERMPPHRRLEHKTMPTPWWLTRLREHPVKSLSTAALITGGLLLLLLFGHIGAFPDLDLGGAIATLLAIAVVGVIVNAIFGGSVLAMGWVMRSEGPRTSWMCMTPSLCVFAAPGAIAVCIAACQLYRSADWIPSLNLAATTAIAALVGTAFLLRWLERGPLAASVPSTRGAASRFRLWKAVQILGVCTAWLCIALMATLTLFAFLPRDMPPEHERVLFPIELACWGLLCYGANIGVARAKREDVARVGVLAVASIFSLYGITQNWTATPVAVARVLGIGQMPVGLVLTREGCDTLNAATRGRKICTIAPSAALGWACPVILQSRIGSPFFVEVSGFGDQGEWPARNPALRISAIAIAKSEVKSWPRIVALPASSPQAGASSPVVGYQHTPATSLSTFQTNWMRAQCESPA
jgi:hypothetical protein